MRTCRGSAVSMARHLLFTLLVLASAATAFAQPVATPTADWLDYRDDANGIAFRYPPNLKVVVPSVEGPNASGLVSIVELWPADSPSAGFAVLAIHVKVCGDPMVACWDDAQRRSCHSFEAFPLGNARAFQCVDFGSAACHWSAQISPGTGIAALFSPPTCAAASTACPRFRRPGLSNGLTWMRRVSARLPCARIAASTRSCRPCRAFLLRWSFYGSYRLAPPSQPDAHQPRRADQKGTAEGASRGGLTARVPPPPTNSEPKSNVSQH